MYGVVFTAPMVKTERTGTRNTEVGSELHVFVFESNMRLVIRKWYQLEWVASPGYERARRMVARISSINQNLVVQDEKNSIPPFRLFQNIWADLRSPRCGLTTLRIMKRVRWNEKKAVTRLRWRLLWCTWCRFYGRYLLLRQRWERREWRAATVICLEMIGWG